eukprot:SAG11_NODE_35801_length_265_cov_0.524096_1_plen_62_part_10
MPPSRRWQPALALPRSGRAAALPRRQGQVPEELSSFDLTKHLTYGGAFGPNMEKQTITEQAL